MTSCPRLYKLLNSYLIRLDFLKDVLLATHLQCWCGIPFFHSKVIPRSGYFRGHRPWRGHRDWWGRAGGWPLHDVEAGLGRQRRPGLGACDQHPGRGAGLSLQPRHGGHGGGHHAGRGAARGRERLLPSHGNLAWNSRQLSASPLHGDIVSQVLGLNRLLVIHVHCFNHFQSLHEVKLSMFMILDSLPNVPETKRESDTR